MKARRKVSEHRRNVRRDLLRVAEQTDGPSSNRGSLKLKELFRQGVVKFAGQIRCPERFESGLLAASLQDFFRVEG